MKKAKLKSLKINKQVISKVDNVSIVGGRILYTIVIECLTEECPTDSQQLGCYTQNPLECIAPPNP